MAGTAEADCAQRNPSGRPSGSLSGLRNDRVRCCPAGSAGAQMEVSPIDVGDSVELERAVAAFSRISNGGLIVTSAWWRFVIATSSSRCCAAQAARGLLRTFFVAAGGFISYGANRSTNTGKQAGYVDRILRGEKPAELPVQAPTKYEMYSISRLLRRWASPFAARDRARRRGDRMNARCPLLAQSGHPSLRCTCPLLGVKRTCHFALQMSAFDPKRTSLPPSSACDFSRYDASP